MLAAPVPLYGTLIRSAILGLVGAGGYTGSDFREPIGGFPNNVNGLIALARHGRGPKVRCSDLCPRLLSDWNYWLTALWLDYDQTRNAPEPRS
jgi:hypothetical protein